MRLFRSHGLGNDYLVYEEGPAMNADLARRLCDRHCGVGGDGVLEPTETARADAGLRIWNPDGSIAEKSGNGIRIFADWLVRRKGAGAEFSIDTGFDVVHCKVGRDAISVAMGRAKQSPEDVPVRAQTNTLSVDLGGTTLPIIAIGMGNPHAVVFVEGAVDDVSWAEWGEKIEVHPLFPNRTNVQFVEDRGTGPLVVRIWERGAGVTMASGSSACAVAVACVVTGRRDAGSILIDMPGGRLKVDVSPQLDVTLVGPVQPIGWIEVDPSWSSPPPTLALELL